jgi:probable HAF family extracellular repeat protein
MQPRIIACVFILSIVTGCSSSGGSGNLPQSAGQMVTQTTGRRTSSAGWESPTSYKVVILGSLGGTNSAANSINQRGWAMGTSFLTGNNVMHAALWRDRNGSATDLGAIGGPAVNSAVEWPVENDLGFVSGISETSTKDPLGESTSWSCHFFLPDGGSLGDTCLGFVWRNSVMTPLPTLGGNNGYAAGMNELGAIAGWAESPVRDATCVSPQQLQFLPVVWNARTLTVHQLPTLTLNGVTDPDGAATAVNDVGEVVGISGICDQAVGRFTGKHAVLWRNAIPINLQTLDGISWNTPTAINDRGQIVGFLNLPGSADQQGLQNFISVIWDNPGQAPTRIGTVAGDSLSEPTGINDEGQVVGVSFPSSDVFVWQRGEMTNLTDLVLASYPQIQLVSVGGINDRGEIAGQACALVNGACPPTATLVTFLAIPQFGGFATAPQARLRAKASPVVPESIRRQVMRHLGLTLR